MRLFVFSDTHLPGRAKSLPQVIIKELGKADYVIHAGDFTSAEFVETLEQTVAFTGVAGNNDGPELQQKLGDNQLIVLEGYKIGIVHGDLGTGSTTLDKAINCFSDQELDLLIFGHSHIPYLNRHGKTWVMNPGSPTDRRRNKSYSYGIVHLAEEIRPELVYFDK